MCGRYVSPEQAAIERAWHIGRHNSNPFRRRMCFRKRATVEDRGPDRYGRTIGRVTCAGMDANAHQIRVGMAWVFVRYAPAGSPLYTLEAEARTAHRGLWSHRVPEAPREWRARPR